MAGIIAAIVAATAVGVWSEYRFGARASAASRSALDFALWVILPPAIFLNLVAAELGSDEVIGIAGGIVSLGLLGICAWLVSTRFLNLPPASTGALISSVTVVNTGYLGYPVVASILGFGALGEAVPYDIIVSGTTLILGSFALGAAYGDNAGTGRRERTRAFFLRNPLLLAAILATFAPDSLAPGWLVDISRVLIIALLPLGFFAIGVTLSETTPAGRSAFRPVLDRAVLTAVGLRLIGGPLLMLAITAPFIKLPETYLLLAAMPCGLSTMIVANAYGLDTRLVAGAVAWSTAVAVGYLSVVAVVT